MIYFFATIGFIVVLVFVVIIIIGVVIAIITHVRLEREFRLQEEWRRTHGRYLKDGSWVHNSLITKWMAQGEKLEFQDEGEAK